MPAMEDTVKSGTQRPSNTVAGAVSRWRARVRESQEGKTPVPSFPRSVMGGSARGLGSPEGLRAAF